MLVKSIILFLIFIINLLSTKTLTAGDIKDEKLITDSNDIDLLTQANIILLKSAISSYNTDRLEECVNHLKKNTQSFTSLTQETKETEKASKCDEKAFLSNLDLLVPKYIKEIPKLNLNDNNWKGNNKNTWKIDKTTHTDILPSDIDGKTTWIFNPYYRNLMVNHSGYNINDFIESYTSTGDETEKINSKLYFYTKAIEISDKYSFELKKIYGSSLYDAFIKRGNIYLNMKDYKKAINDFFNARRTAKLTGNKDLILKSLISLSIAYKLNNDLSSSIKYLKEAVEMDSTLENKINYGTFKIDEEQKVIIKSLFNSIK
jgi:tetratricopeptide (TPR) repeat protein